MSTTFTGADAAAADAYIAAANAVVRLQASAEELEAHLEQCSEFAVGQAYAAFIMSLAGAHRQCRAAGPPGPAERGRGITRRERQLVEILLLSVDGDRRRAGALAAEHVDEFADDAAALTRRRPLVPAARGVVAARGRRTSVATWNSGCWEHSRSSTTGGTLSSCEEASFAPSWPRCCCAPGSRFRPTGWPTCSGATTPPSGAANALQAQVSKLRRLLADVPLEGRDGGYVLVVDPAADRRRAVHAAGQGSATSTSPAGRHAEAAATLRDALGAVARAGAGGLRVRRVRPGAAHAARGDAARRPRGPHRRRPGLRPARGRRRRARRPGARAPAARAAVGPADARAVPMRPAVRQPARLPARHGTCWPTSSGSTRARRCASSSGRCWRTTRRSTHRHASPPSRATGLSNIHPELSTFVGRAADVAHIVELLQTAPAGDDHRSGRRRQDPHRDGDRRASRTASWRDGTWLVELGVETGERAVDRRVPCARSGRGSGTPAATTPSTG